VRAAARSQRPRFAPTKNAVDADTALARPRLDLRCTHLAPHSAIRGITARCQLWAGHDGPHAVMFCRHGNRTVRVWTESARTGWRDLSCGYESLPWLLGFPVPAWQDRP
jgi:hypothetical protein